MSNEGSRQKACSAAINPAPPVPRMRMSVVICAGIQVTKGRREKGFFETTRKLTSASAVRLIASVKFRADRGRDNFPTCGNETHPLLQPRDLNVLFALCREDPR